MQNIEALTFGKYYHIYNRGINSCNIYSDIENYKYFLKLYKKYITPIAVTYAWALMPNHFHFLIRIKEENEILSSAPLTGFQTLSGIEVGYQSLSVFNPLKPEKSIIGSPSQQFSKLFNSYAQAFNKRFNRHGALFERAFKRKLIENEKYLKKLVLYIHNNPVHHGISKHPEEYLWTSYISYISENSSMIEKEFIIYNFENIANFKASHNFKVDYTLIENYLKINL